jgi:hypothetical protein
MSSEYLPGMHNDASGKGRTTMLKIGTNAKTTTTPHWRHGDVMVAAVEALPEGAQALPTKVLAYGEVTGHSHRIEDPRSADVYELNGVRYVRVTAESARLVHEEHKPIVLPRGIYRFWHQREYTPTAIVRVID